ncbi:MAG: ComEC/Rec2 family competence protein [Clostridia bacterium]|nr:ComEC/Rec2 family competence protein [Clostridia bacterium]
MRKKREGEKELRGKLFNFRPLLFHSLFFAYGIFCAFLRIVKGWNFAVIFAPCLIALVLFFSKERKGALRKGTTLFLCFSLGVLSLSAQVKDHLSGNFYQGEYWVSAKVIEKEERQDYDFLYLESLNIGGIGEDGKMFLTVWDGSASGVKGGQEIYVRAKVTSKANRGRDGFFFGSIADDLRFHATATSKLTVTNEKSDLFSSVRERFKRTLYKGMDESAADVSYALLTGSTYGIDAGLMENIRRGGIAHIFAVSGLHIGALFGFCVLLCSKTRLSKLPDVGKFVLTASVVLFYGGVCGFTPSVVRATTVCLISYLCKTIGVKSDGLERTGGAMAIVLLLNPAELFTAGFLLSFSACYGIFTIGNSLQRGLKKVFDFTGEKGKAVFGFLGVSFGAQLFTAPILLFFFGYLSVWGLFLNFLFVPLIGMVFAPLLAIVGACSILPVGISSVVVRYVGDLVSAGLFVFEVLDFSFVIQSFQIGWIWTVVWFAVMALLSGKVRLKKEKVNARFEISKAEKSV